MEYAETEEIPPKMVLKAVLLFVMLVTIVWLYMQDVVGNFETMILSVLYLIVASFVLRVGPHLFTSEDEKSDSKFRVCPRCGSMDISRLKGVYWPEMFGGSASYRCLNCRYRGLPLLLDTEEDYRKFLMEKKLGRV